MLIPFFLCWMVSLVGGFSFFVFPHSSMFFSFLPFFYSFLLCLYIMIIIIISYILYTEKFIIIFNLVRLSITATTTTTHYLFPLIYTYIHILLYYKIQLLLLGRGSRHENIYYTNIEKSRNQELPRKPKA